MDTAEFGLMGEKRTSVNQRPLRPQQKQMEWHYQWEQFEGETPFLFFDWIKPRTLDDFRGKRVLDAGCGPGHHMKLVAPVAQHVTGMDLNAHTVAQVKLKDLDNVTVLEGDIALHQPDDPYDVVYCIGVIHHTDDPDSTFENLKQMVKPGGLLIIWCYSQEGNELVWKIVEPLRQRFLANASRKTVARISSLLTLLMYPFVYTIYLLSFFKWLPFYEYFQNFRRMSFGRNALNVFDKLNAPRTEFISRERIQRWFEWNQFQDVSITAYKGISWRASGIVRAETN
jgi:2-polyprenyl-3-methyl-5-hydroxy-6-metoxy-1,4-benzoquinol methylase